MVIVMLTADMKRRLKAITDVFYKIDGISFERAVEINEEDANPEKNISIYEEMVRVYEEACSVRPMGHAEKQEIYNILLLRSFYDEQETISRIEPQILPRLEAISIIKQYRLAAEPAVLYVEE